MRILNEPYRCGYNQLLLLLVGAVYTGGPHPTVIFLNIPQVQRHVSRQKPWHEPTFYVDLSPRCEF
jgi:hypothetical protein